MAQKKKKIKHQYEEKVEQHLTHQVVTREFAVMAQNRQIEDEEFDLYMDLLEGNRPEADYDWMSNLSIPELASHIYAQQAIDVRQYFQTRDFTECYVEDEAPESISAADAYKELINRTLNQRHIHYFQKFVRGKTLANFTGRCYGICWWERTNRPVAKTRYVERESATVDIYDRPLINPDQVPALEEYAEEYTEYEPVIDRFNFDIIDPRNIFMSNEYTYNLRDKRVIIVRDEITLDELRERAESEDYFNLDLLENALPQGESQTSKESYNARTQHTPVYIDKNAPFDRLRRYGKYWCIVTKERDGFPLEVEPGIDENGKIKDGAVLEEIIITVAKTGNTETLIGFSLTPCIDCYGVPYKPLLRGIGYIHPVDDGGVGDGRYTKDLQKGIDDTFNMSNDRVRLVTMPTMAVKKYAAEDNTTLFFQPDHFIELEDPKNDLQEINFSSDITGSLAQINMLTNKMQQMDSMYQPQLGSVPGADTTATASVQAGQSVDARTNLKSMTFENTFLQELYWMVGQMTYRYAHRQTAMKLMGRKSVDFDPFREDYFFKPLSQSIESEQSKYFKIKIFTQLMGYALNAPHPDAMGVANAILQRIFALSGDEAIAIAGAMFNTNKPMIPQGAGGQVSNENAMPTNNQNMIPMSMPEQITRSMASA